MMLHAPVMLFALGALIAAGPPHYGGGYWSGPAAVGIAGLGVLFVERTIGGISAWRRTGDPAALGFAIAHLVRDVAWALAIVTWFARYALKRDGRPAHSMRRSAVMQTERAASPPPLAELSILAVVPALNEHANLPAVVADLSRVLPLRNILIVDDGSTDGTQELLPQLGVRWLTLSQRLGVGGAVRAGIRFARQSGYDYVVRIDGDGQHRACDIARVLEPVLAGRAHAALGSRFLRRPQVRGWRRLSQVTPGQVRQFRDAAASHRSNLRLLAVRAGRATLAERTSSRRVRGTRAVAVPEPQWTRGRRDPDPDAAEDRGTNIAHRPAHPRGGCAHSAGAARCAIQAARR